MLTEKVNLGNAVVDIKNWLSSTGISSPTNSYILISLIKKLMWTVTTICHAENLPLCPVSHKYVLQIITFCYVVYVGQLNNLNNPINIKNMDPFSLFLMQTQTSIYIHRRFFTLIPNTRKTKKKLRKSLATHGDNWWQSPEFPLVSLLPLLYFSHTAHPRPTPL